MMSVNHPVILFAGPSLFGAFETSTLLDGIELRRPISRGDLPPILKSKKPGVLIIADGLFHQCLSVGHAEIRDAMSSSWAVWGVASMGAIRAAEMCDMGMRGFGRVFSSYASDANFRDDEVTLLHSPKAPYAPFSEPLVHLREAVRVLEAENLIDANKGRFFLEYVANNWYGIRTIDLMLDCLANGDKDLRLALQRRCESFNEFRIKTLDLVNLLKEKPWMK